MPERTSYAPGTPCWIDIGTDLDGAKPFYTALFGWTTMDAGPVEETGGYGFFMKGDKMVAGYGPQMNPGPPVWATYIAVADADATSKLIEAAGGSIVMPAMDVMGAGRMAVFQDSAGGFCSIWQPGEHKGAQVANEPGAFSWNELNSRAWIEDIFAPCTAEERRKVLVDNPCRYFHLDPDAELTPTPAA